MRCLTPVGIREKFVASGTHTGYRRGPDEALIPSGVVEYWTIHDLPDQTRIIRGDRQADKADGDMQVLATMVGSPTGQTERMDMRVYVGPALAAEARYMFFGDHVEISRRTRVSPGAYGEREHTEMALPAGYRVDFGRITISRGFIVRAALAQAVKAESQASGETGTRPADSRIPVFAPHNPGGSGLLHDASHLLAGSMAYYSAESVESTSYPLGRRTLNGQKCQIFIADAQGGGHGYSAILDEQGVMLEDGSDTIFRLTQYALRPEGL